jgi:hypothetical protein
MSLSANKAAVEAFFSSRNVAFFRKKEAYHFFHSLASLLNEARFVVSPRERYIQVYAHCVINCPEVPQARAKVNEYLTRANFGLTNGNFEFDLDDGEILYKVHLATADNEPSDAQIEAYIRTSIDMMERYGTGLVKIMFDHAADVRACITAAEGETSDETECTPSGEPDRDDARVLLRRLRELIETDCEGDDAELKRDAAVLLAGLQERFESLRKKADGK